MEDPCGTVATLQHPRCPGQHHSLLLAELGWLPEVDLKPGPPTPAAPAAALAPTAVPEVECPEREGIGCAGFDEDGDGRYRPVGRCARCDGEGVIPRRSFVNCLE